MQYKLFTMKDILMNLVQTNMVVLGQFKKNDNGMQYYIICGEQDTDELFFQWFKCKSQFDVDFLY